MPPADQARAPGAAVGPVVLAATLAVAAALTAIPVAVLLTEVPAGFARFEGPQQAQGAKTALYLLAFGVLLPAGGLLAVGLRRWALGRAEPSTPRHVRGSTAPSGRGVDGSARRSRDPDRARDPDGASDPDRSRDPDRARDPDRIGDPERASDPDRIGDPSRAGEAHRPHDADRTAALAGLAAVAPGALAAAVVAVRLSAPLPWGDGLPTLLVALLVWWAALLVVGLAVVGGVGSVRRRLAAAPTAAWAASATLVLVAVWATADLAPRVAAGLLVGGAVGAVVVGRLGTAPRRPARRHRWADVAVALAVVLTVPNLVVFTAATGPVNDLVAPGVYRFHHDFLLGPAATVLAGGTPLVDAPVAQYGLGPTYLVAAWSALVGGAGYGTLGLLDGVLTAAAVGAVPLVLVATGVRRSAAAAATLVSIGGLVLAYRFPVGGIPQQGPLRFGPPMLVLVAWTLATARAARPAAATAATDAPQEDRPDRLARAWRALALLSLGGALAWSLEAGVYAGLTAAVLAATEVRLRPPGRRWRALGRRAAQAVAAVVLVQLLVAAVTLLRSGALPDWGGYLAYLRAFLGGGGAGAYVLGFEPWSAGLALGAGVLASGVALLALLARPARIPDADRPLVVLVAGASALAAAYLSYTANRSSSYLFLHVALPPVIAATGWAVLAARWRARLPAGLPRALAAGTVAVAAGLVAAGLPRLLDRAPETPVGRLIAGDPGPRAALARLRANPVLDPRATGGERLLARAAPDARRVLVLVRDAPDLGVEVQLRADRANALPIGAPPAASYVPDASADLLRPAVARLPDRLPMLTDERGLAELRAGGAPAPPRPPDPGLVTFGPWLTATIAERFQALPVDREAPFVLVELRRRPPGARPAR